MTEKVGSTSIELLTFRLAEQEYALDIMSVREIRGWTHATSLPHAPPYMKGVINLRGTVLPVMDLASRLGMADRKQNERSVIIVVNFEDTMTGLLVDAVSDIVAVTDDDLQPPPELAANTIDGVVSALTLIDERMIRVLNLPITVNSFENAAA
ncbi:chemotaxis protein CheW [Sulfitobacter sp. M57]|uniref:chemotaxis protein CheW n=1 Tax=unclassified Sulfitobacter TaxID=196795 RepID=UPI0023E20F33|nr:MULTISPECIES: chemotaxis protein CheW [unclassified Sulfitobacter]MDF3413714.1 chemotaxis protein CheW [Sulfitobacter sp. KE5]MDF3421005.1 chemotaxis protein CheW [Sulfitobacter sp. KE43]MDF3432260.1 chemotaxis protein CheW [Sulfitobacter sp. KE42]MDF3457899.1 chemotaxis protein CheW [Sulfitobacter sp. S74]MDF3461800.1 chemotaxis protein CheW [Sulfitobacter sp. Ks18]